MERLLTEARHSCVKTYLGNVKEELAQARVIPKRATPFFFDKLSKLCTYLDNLVFRDEISSVQPSQRYLATRDLAFFCLEFYAGDRASDLGRVLTKEIARLPEDYGFLFRHTFGKTLRGENAF